MSISMSFSSTDKRNRFSLSSIKLNFNFDVTASRI